MLSNRGREWTANVLLGLGALLWSIPVASIQALATADQIGKVSFVKMTCMICFDFDSATAQRIVTCVLAHVPGMAWIATLNGGEVAAFVSAVDCIV